MQVDCQDNSVDITLDYHEFVHVLMMVGAIEEYRENGFTEEVLYKCFPLFVQLSFLGAQQIESDADLDFLNTGCTASMEVCNGIIKVHLSPVSSFSSLPLLSVPEVSEKELYDRCMNCFIHKMIPRIVGDMQSFGNMYNEKDIEEAVFSSSCFEWVMDSFIPEKARSEFKDSLTDLIKCLLEEEPKVRIFYRVKDFDTAVSLVPYVKRGHIIKQKDRYYVVSNRDHDVFVEYGELVDSFAYTDDMIICGIKDGKLINKKELDGFFESSTILCAYGCSE